MSPRDGETYTIDEPTAWLRLAVHNRVMEILPIIEDAPADFIMTVLVEPPEDSEGYDNWDHTCDRCLTLVPMGDMFLTGQSSIRHMPTGKIIVVTYGLCRTCGEKETLE